MPAARASAARRCATRRRPRFADDRRRRSGPRDSRACAPRAAAPRHRVAPRLPMTVVDARASRGSPGFGVSGDSPPRPRSSARRRQADTPPRRRTAAGRRARRRNVLASATVGPDAITLEIVADDVGDRAASRHGAAGARREPAALDRREMLAHGIERVDVGAARAAAARCVARLSSSVRPSAGTAISADAPPDSSTSSDASSGAAAGESRAPGAPRARSPPVGTGWPPTISSKRVRHVAGVRRDDQAGRARARRAGARRAAAIARRRLAAAVTAKRPA